MAGSRAIEAAKAFVRILADDSKFRKVIGTVKGTLLGVASTAKAAGLAISKAMFATGIGAIISGVSAAAAAVMQFSSMGAGIDDVAKRTGASAEGLSQLKYAAEQSGATLEDVEKGMRKLGDVTTQAANGSKSAQEALAKVGATAEQLSTMRPEDRLLAIVQGLSQITDPAERASVAMDVLGKSGANLLPMMEDGAAGVAAMMAEADALGLTLSGPQAEAAAAFDDAFAKLSATFSTFAKVVGSALAPVLADVMNFISGAIPVAMQFANVIGGVMVSAAQRGWQALSLMLEGFGPIMQAAKDTFGGITDALTSGDMSLAARVMWASLKAAWLEGTAGLNREWLAWKSGFIQVFADAMAALKSAWASTQNWLSNGIIELMGMIDSSINVEAAQAELDVMLQQQTADITRQAEADKATAEASYAKQIGQAEADLKAARDEWGAALEAAKRKTQQQGNAPTAGEVANDKFTELIQAMKSGDIATRVDAAVSQSTVSQDLRTVGGAGQLTGIINAQGNLSQRQVTLLQKIQANSAKQLELTRQGQIGYAV
jgi:undecaprenyl pyrophosphate synthase